MRLFNRTFLFAAVAALILSPTIVFGDADMAGASKLQSAAIEVRDSAISMKAYYGAAPPDENSTRASEKLLKSWGKFSEGEMVYFMGIQDGRTYGLSLVSDPGKWSGKAFPSLKLKRVEAGEGEAVTFVVTFDKKEGTEHKERIEKALGELIAAEGSGTKLEVIYE